MRKWKISLSIVIMFCVGGLVGNQAFGTVLLPFADGFENRPVGDYPNENGWEVLFSPGNESVSDVVAHTGTKSFNLDNSSNYIYIGPPESTPNQMSYEASIYIPVGVEVYGWVGFANPSGWYAGERNAFTIDTRGGVNKVTFGAFYVNRPEEDPLIDVGTYTPGTWATVRADLDFDTLQADLWLNGSLAVSNAPIKPKEWTHPELGTLVTDRLAIGTISGDVYFDDISLTSEPALLAGDANRDGVVSASDYAAIQGFFGQTGSPGMSGDANGDGVVSAGDYASVQANFGNVGSTVEVTPEPATLSLLVIGGIAMIRRRRK